MSNSLAGWCRRLGLVGIAFFALKGLLWLVLAGAGVLVARG